MKRKSLFLTLALLAISPGCARFATTQRDITYDPSSGAKVHQIYTRASSHSFLESQSKLVGWKAGNANTQTAEVGSLDQSASIEQLRAILSDLGQKLMQLK